MVGSTFILVNRDGKRTLLNAAEIVALHTENIDLSTDRGKFVYNRYDPAQGILYTVQLMLTSTREMEFIFTTVADQTAFYDQLLAALSPSVVIENSAPRPVLQEQKLPESEESPRLYTREEVYMTHEEMMRGLEKAVAKQRGEQSPPAPTPPAK